MKKNLQILTTILLFTASIQAQENPFRLGVKVGIPIVYGFNVEYVSSLLDGRLAPTIDYTSIDFDFEDTESSYSYFEFGANYYLKQQGKGLYSHLSVGLIGFEATYTDPELGIGSGELDISLINMKLGAKVGNRIYLRPEIGYAVSMVGSVIEVQYLEPTTGSLIVQEEELPSSIMGGFVFNVGLGLSF
mgnify:FL=1|jgi:hypothetical protein